MGGLEPSIQCRAQRGQRNKKVDGVRTLSLLTMPGHDKLLEVRWVLRDALPNVELPTVMRKIVEHGLDEGGPLFALRKP